MVGAVAELDKGSWSGRPLRWWAPTPVRTTAPPHQEATSPAARPRTARPRPFLRLDEGRAGRVTAVADDDLAQGAGSSGTSARRWSAHCSPHLQGSQAHQLGLSQPQGAGPAAARGLRSRVPPLSRPEGGPSQVNAPEMLALGHQATAWVSSWGRAGAHATAPARGHAGSGEAPDQRIPRRPSKAAL